MAHIPDTDPGPLVARTDWFPAWHLLLRVGRGVKVQLLPHGEWVSLAPSGYVGVHRSLFPELWNQLKSGPRSFHCPSLVCCQIPSSPSPRAAPGLCGIFVKLEKDAQCSGWVQSCAWAPGSASGALAAFQRPPAPPAGCPWAVPSVQLCPVTLAIPSLCCVKAPKPAQGEQPAARLVPAPPLLLPPRLRLFIVFWG